MGGCRDLVERRPSGALDDCGGARLGRRNSIGYRVPASRMGPQIRTRPIVYRDSRAAAPGRNGNGASSGLLRANRAGLRQDARPAVAHRHLRLAPELTRGRHSASQRLSTGRDQAPPAPWRRGSGRQRTEYHHGSGHQGDGGQEAHESPLEGRGGLRGGGNLVMGLSRSRVAMGR
jgi:hypothetical protein